MKRWISLLLSVIMILAACPEVYAANTVFVPCENLDYSLISLDGSTVSTRAEGKPKVLIFFKNGCGNCSYMLKALKDSGKKYDNLDVIAAEFAGGTLEETKMFCSTYETSGITYCCGASIEGWQYKTVLQPEGNSVMTPLVVYINEKNQIVQYSTGYDKNFLKHMEEYLSIILLDQEIIPEPGGDDSSGMKPGTDTDTEPVDPFQPTEPDKTDDSSEPEDSDEPDKPAESEKPDINNEYTYKNVIYKVLTFNGSEGTVEVSSVENRSVKNLNISNTVKINGYTFKIVSVGNGAFESCMKLKTVKLGKNVASIGNKAFYGCKKLKTVSGCEGVISIGNKAFFNCEELLTVGSRSKVVTLKKVKIIGDSAFYGCKAVRKVNLTSAALTKIGTSAFQGCTSMTSFTASSKKLTSIGRKAFYGNKKLGTVSLKTEKLKKSKTGSSAFKGIKSTCKFKVPKKQVSIYKKIFMAKGAGSKFKISGL